MSILNTNKNLIIYMTKDESKKEPEKKAGRETERFVSAQFVAKALNIKEELVLKAIEAGVLKGQQSHGQWFISEKNFQEYTGKIRRNT